MGVRAELEERQASVARRRVAARRVIWAACCLLACAALLTITGVPGPAPVSRHLASELTGLADRLNADWHRHRGGSVASVDWVRGRVWVDAIAAECGLVTISAGDRSMIESGQGIQGEHTCPLAYAD